MNVKSMLSLIVAGAILSACAGSPKPEINLELSPDDLSWKTDKFLPQTNQDGTVTLFSHKGVDLKIPLLTDAGTRGATRGRSTNEFDAVIAQNLAALQANPLDFDTCISLAGLYLDRDNPTDPGLAVQYSNQALTLVQNDPQALYTRGLAYYKQGDNPKALVDLETVMKLDIQSMKGAYYVMGLIHYKEGKIGEAIQVLEKVQALDPQFADTGEVLQELYGMRG